MSNQLAVCITALQFQLVFLCPSCSASFVRFAAAVADIMFAITGHYRAGETARDATPSFVVFLDEVNTSSIMGSVQDVLIDKSLEGEPLPDNIFWVCATNPYRAPPTAKPAAALGTLFHYAAFVCVLPRSPFALTHADCASCPFPVMA